MKVRVFFVLALLALAVPVAAQTTPFTCPTPVTTTVVLNPQRFFVTLTQFTDPAVVRYEMSVHPRGADHQVDKPVQVDTYDKAAFTPVAGATNCYTALAKPTPKDVELFGVLRAVSAGPLGEVKSLLTESVVSNPFGSPTVKAAPSRVAFQ